MLHTKSFLAIYQCWFISLGGVALRKNMEGRTLFAGVIQNNKTFTIQSQKSKSLKQKYKRATKTNLLCLCVCLTLGQFIAASLVGLTLLQ